MVSSSRDLGDLAGVLNRLSTANIADAVLKLELPLRLAPHGLIPLIRNKRIFGPARPVQHFGSVDIFLEAMEHSAPGEVLVIGNGGRVDEAAIGDLIVHEVKAAGLAGLIIWGAHRDTDDVLKIGLPVWSLGPFPSGPVRLDPRKPGAFEGANVGNITVTQEDFVFADSDGVIFFPMTHLQEIVEAAGAVRKKETAQAEALEKGTSLRTQLQFSRYLDRRKNNKDYSFRQHLKEIGGAIEE